MVGQARISRIATAEVRNSAVLIMCKLESVSVLQITCYKLWNLAERIRQHRLIFHKVNVEKCSVECGSCVMPG